jgi:hypothetical protein
MDAGEFNVIKCDSVSIVILTNLPLLSANNSPLCVLFYNPYCEVDYQEKLIQYCMLLLLRLELEQNLHLVSLKIFFFEIISSNQTLGTIPCIG